MNAFLEIEFVRDEPSKIRVRASNGRFSGFSETYTNAAWLESFCKELSAFPSTEERDVEFESSRGKGESADCYLKVFLSDELGHVEVFVALKEGVYSGDNPDKAKFTVRCEMASIDNFVTSCV